MEILTRSNHENDPDQSSLLLIPAMLPPPGSKSNFDTPPPSAQIIRVITGLFVLFAVVFQVIRIYTRMLLLKGHQLSWDDGMTLTINIAFRTNQYRVFDFSDGKPSSHLLHCRDCNMTSDGFYHLLRFRVPWSRFRLWTPSLGYPRNRSYTPHSICKRLYDCDYCQLIVHAALCLYWYNIHSFRFPGQTLYPSPLPANLWCVRHVEAPYNLRVCRNYIYHDGYARKFNCPARIVHWWTGHAKSALL